MSKTNKNFTKESTKIRRRMNRQRRHQTNRVIKMTQDETKIPIFKGSEGWETW